MARTTDNDETIGFSDAMDELARIVSELEADDIDLDLMADRVERAALLVSHCRERLDATRFRVEQIIVGLGTDDGPEDPTGSESADGPGDPDDDQDDDED